MATLNNTAGFWPVAAAIVGNSIVTVLKFFAGTVSGSSSMIAEAIHSLADTLNQILLLIGLRRSLKKKDEGSDYGYGNERFFWALISACGIFFVGAGVTAWHGLGALAHPEPIELSPLVFIVLFISFVIELYTLRIAAQQLKKAYPNLSWRERIHEADSSTLAVLLEDSVAVLGLSIATLSITASYLTGNAIWDTIGSLVIAGMLAIVAVVLIVKNRSYLIGRPLSEEDRDDIIKFLNAEPAIEKVIDFKSHAVGFGAYRINCDVEFNGNSVLRAGFRGAQMRREYEEARASYEDFKRFLADYGDRIPRLVGKKIDEIEKRLREKFPQVQHIDIEIN